MSHANALVEPDGPARGWPAASSMTAGRCGGRRNGSRSRCRPRSDGRGATGSWARREWRTGPVATASLHRADPARTERRIIKLRYLRRWGPARIGLPPRACIRRRCTRCLSPVQDGPAGLAGPADRPGGPPLRAPRSPATWCTSTSRSSAGSPTAAATRCSAEQPGTRSRRAANRPGYAFIHNAVDDHSRLAYSEILRRRDEGDRGRHSGAGPRRSSPAYGIHGPSGC